MATYLQGVTDYIPQIQPFKPDFNFYDKILKTKQNQYDSNWKQLNNIYSQYYYANVTRDDSRAKKDELMKNIDFNLRRVSGLDLSLQQNVDQAKQVFTPFYQDKLLLRDMALTKGATGQIQRGQAFKNSGVKDDNAKWWQGGVDYINYKMQEFKDATPEEAMTMGVPEYVAYRNTMKESLALIKDAGISRSHQEVGDMWITTMKNGELIRQPVTDLINSTLGADSGVQQVYRVQAYLNRKNYANNNANRFDGDVKAAEREYLQQNYNIIKASSQREYNRLDGSISTYSAQIADVKKQIADGTAQPNAEQYVANLEMNRDIAQKNKDILATTYDLVNPESSTLTTTNGGVDPFEDLGSLISIVDGGVAQRNLNTDLQKAINRGINVGAEVSHKANPYGVAKVKHMYASQRAAANRKFRREENEKDRIFKAKLQNQKEINERKQAYLENMYDKGLATYKEIKDANGNIIDYQLELTKEVKQPDFSDVPADESGGSVSTDSNLYEIQLEEAKKAFEKNIQSGFTNASTALNTLLKAKVINDDNFDMFALFGAEIGDMLLDPSIGQSTRDQINAYHEGNPAVALQKFNVIKDWVDGQSESIKADFTEKILNALGDYILQSGSAIAKDGKEFAKNYTGSQLKVVQDLLNEQAGFKEDLRKARVYKEWEPAFQDWQNKSKQAITDYLERDSEVKDLNPASIFKKDGTLKSKDEWMAEPSAASFPTLTGTPSVNFIYHPGLENVKGSKYARMGNGYKQWGIRVTKENVEEMAKAMGQWEIDNPDSPMASELADVPGGRSTNELLKNLDRAYKVMTYDEAFRLIKSKDGLVDYSDVYENGKHIGGSGHETFQKAFGSRANNLFKVKKTGSKGWISDADFDIVDMGPAGGEKSATEIGIDLLSGIRGLTFETTRDGEDYDKIYEAIKKSPIPAPLFSEGFGNGLVTSIADKENKRLTVRPETGTYGKSFQAADKLYSDLSKYDVGPGAQMRITAGPNPLSKTALEQMDEQASEYFDGDRDSYDEMFLKKMLDDWNLTYMSNPDGVKSSAGKPNEFTITKSDIAQNRFDKDAYTFRLPPWFVKEYIQKATAKGDVNVAGISSDLQEQVDLNGINVIIDDVNLPENAWSINERSMEATIADMKGQYTYIDPTGAGTYTIKPVVEGSIYKMEGSINQMIELEPTENNPYFRVTRGSVDLKPYNNLSMARMKNQLNIMQENFDAIHNQYLDKQREVKMKNMLLQQSLNNTQNNQSQR